MKSDKGIDDVEKFDHRDKLQEKIDDKIGLAQNLFPATPVPT
jgi:hypothetical protein